MKVPDSTAASAGGATPISPTHSVCGDVAELRGAFVDVLLRAESCVHGVSFLRRCVDCDEAEA